MGHWQSDTLLLLGLLTSSPKQPAASFVRDGRRLCLACVCSKNGDVQAGMPCNALQLTACWCARRADARRVPRSALAVLASSSGVSSERAAFMELVRAEIERLNRQLGKRGSVSMVFQKGSVLVRRCACSAHFAR